jgi:hypothetical protein
MRILDGSARSVEPSVAAAGAWLQVHCMDRLLARLERSLGRWAIPNLTHYLVGLTALCFVLVWAKPTFINALVFVPELVLHRLQLWRVITFLFIPHSSIYWIIFELWFLWLVGNSLEGAWGAFKFNVYYFLGAGATIASAFILGLVFHYPLVVMDNEFLNDSLLLAFATLFPDFQILLFVFPVRVKWLGLFTGGMLVWRAWSGDTPERIAIAVAVANYLLFFGGHLVGLLRGSARVAQQAKRRAEFLPTERITGRPKRACALCGKTDEDPDADLRVCTCAEVCKGKPTVYCLEHARSHQRPAA